MSKIRSHLLVASSLILAAACMTAPTTSLASDEPGEKQLSNLLKRFPKADLNGDGKLTAQEAATFRSRRQPGKKAGKLRPGAPPEPKVNAGWDTGQFPEGAVCFRDADEIARLYASLPGVNGDAVISYEKPKDGSLRIVGTGHSFMAPGYRTLPQIAKAAGLEQPPLVTHTGGGVTGSARYKWEQENGIFQFAGKPRPKLLSSIANAKWDAMMWGPYFHDRPLYYSCWIDFCLKYNPEMKFFLSDAWPQLDQLDSLPKSKADLTPELFVELGRQRNEANQKLIGDLNKKYPGKIFVMPTSDAMVLAVDYFHRGKLPGVEGVHKLLGNRERSLWRDRLGHLGPGLGQLEGYVFYSTLYRKSPEQIPGEIQFSGVNGYPSNELDRIFREIAWKAVTSNPLSGVVDKNNDGVGD